MINFHHTSNGRNIGYLVNDKELGLDESLGLSNNDNDYQ